MDLFCGILDSTKHRDAMNLYQMTKFYWSKLKALASDKIELSKMMVENIVGKGENAGNLHFLLFSQCF